MTETEEVRRKRLAMRAWRRGTKEMDLLLGGYADAHLPRMAAPELDAFEALLAEQDQDLLAWATGQAPAPAVHAELLARVTDLARVRRSASN